MDVSDALIVNRLYDACFHAAQAVRYERGYEPSSHGGVLSLFGSAVVVPGDAARDQGRFLNRLGELRKQADYGYEAIEADVDSLVSRSTQFVAEMEDLCSISE